ncbi:MAG: hypothetical protein Kow0027_07380 [Saprospiraceae bacterium]
MTNVQLLGVEGSEKMKKLRNNVETALSRLGMDASVKVVSDVEELMRFKINGIPALVINGKVVLQKVVPEVEDLQILLNLFKDQLSKSFDMNDILVPTDFSTVSADALKFAVNLASVGNGSVTVLHISHPEFDPNLLFPEMNFQDLEAFQKDRMDHFLKEVFGEEIPENINSKVEIGFAVEQIVKHSASGEFDLIVMGGRGDKGTLEKWFGSVSTSVTQLAKCPVLLIPQGTIYEPFKHILFASNFESTTPETLSYLSSIATTFGADVHFVHVQDESSSKQYKEIEKRLFEILFEGGEPAFSFTMTTVEGESVSEALNEYANKHNIDLMIMVHPHRSFWENIFHKSVTRSMAFNNRIPLMVIPA